MYRANATGQPRGRQAALRKVISPRIHLCIERQRNPRSARQSPNAHEFAVIGPQPAISQSPGENRQNGVRPIGIVVGIFRQPRKDLCPEPRVRGSGTWLKIEGLDHPAQRARPGCEATSASASVKTSWVSIIGCGTSRRRSDLALRFRPSRGLDKATSTLVSTRIISICGVSACGSPAPRPADP